MTIEAEPQPVRPGLAGRWWFRPAFFMLLPVTMSFLAWMGLVGWREFGERTSSWAKLSGFAEPSTTSASGIVLLVVWYAAAVSVATIGWRLGTDKKLDPATVERISSPNFEKRYFLLVLAAALVGVLYSYYKIGSSQSILDSLTTQSNQFTTSLPGYAGIQTLRSATILAAPVGIYLWRKKVIGFHLMALSVLLLVLNAAIASRLSLFMAAFVFVTIMVVSRVPSKRVRLNRGRRWMTLIVIGAVGFGVLTGLNYIRNANYYRDAGVANPFEMNLYQMGAYLATPAQVSLGVAEAVMSGSWEQTGHRIDSINAAQPTFLQFTKVSKEDGLREGAFYGYSVVLESNFTTNSVFADTYAIYGMWGWVYAILLYSVAGYLFARLVRYGVVVAGSAGVMAYALSEIWRTQIVNYGFVIFLLLLTWACAVAALLWCRVDERAAPF
ncbi:O-antigen polymerase [Mycolicibacterium baixiangningiae]|uniref:O-antigen polymerase n=1 Tax=Mycolicibacterium baixiangningiae TaxID=2761578 RepID=UPI001E4CE8FF|nr:O-antigen polymerase [Mycolicibacterium baixiangningiae]